MKKSLFTLLFLVISSLTFANEKHLAKVEDLKIEIFPELKGDELAVDIKITNVSERSVYIQKGFLEVEDFCEDFQQNQMAGTILLAENEKNEWFDYCGHMGTLFILDEWKAGWFTRLDSGKTINCHITNLFNSYPDARNCEYITVYYSNILGVSEPVRVQLK